MGVKMVKSIKTALKKAIDDTVLTPFELYTCILNAVNLVNQWLIGKSPNDPNECYYLCPNDILWRRCYSKIPRGSVRETKNPRHRFGEYWVCALKNVQCSLCWIWNNILIKKEIMLNKVVQKGMIGQNASYWQLSSLYFVLIHIKLPFAAASWFFYCFKLWFL